MKRAIAVGLVALLSACASEEERQLSYGPAQQPTVAEQGAASTAQATLQSSLTFAPSTEPTAGAMGLADQLVAGLGGFQAAVAAPLTMKQSAVGGRVTAQAFDTGGMDPACVTITPTSATWSGCVIDVTETDPYSGDTTHMRVTVDGTLGWSAGVSSWNVDETFAMTMTSGGETIAMNGTARMLGEITATGSTVVGHTSSNVDLTESYMGFNVSVGIANTLDLDLDYQADPFCFDGGTLRLQQIWTRRPMGATPEQYPDQGWLFEWTGCGAFTVAHGS